VFISCGVRTPRDSTFIPNTLAAACTSFSVVIMYALSGFQRTAICGKHLSEQFQTFPFQFRRQRCQSCAVSARPREACHQTGAYRIADRHHHERDRGCRLLYCQSGRCACGYEQINLESDEFGDQGRKLLIVSFGPSIFDQDVVAFEVAEVTQPVTQWLDEIFLKGSGRVPQEAYSRDTRRLLRPCPERPRGRCAAEQCHERAAVHSITSSAMARTPGGIVRLSDLATLRLISSSNLPDCTTGRSAGRAPLKILPL
jgi:hypothetical protein